MLIVTPAPSATAVTRALDSGRYSSRMGDQTQIVKRAAGIDDDTVAIPAPTPCQCCAQLVAVRPRRGALRFPHKCPHGRDCAAGDPLMGAHLAGRGTCEDCNRDRLAERLGAR